MSGYSSIQSHRSMTFDTERNAAYLQAIKQAVHSDSIVMDLGSGLGIHGLSAARVGAKKVYLVEPEPIIDLAKKIAEANQLPNIETRQIRIEHLSLPEKVDVIISVFTGNFLLEENLLPSLLLARDKFLAPGGKLIPDRAKMYAVPVYAPEYHQEYIGKWADFPESDRSEQINLSQVRQYAANSIYYDTAENFNATFLSSPGKLLELDLMTSRKSDCDSQIQLTIDHDSMCHGWLGWFTMHLGEDWFSTSPKAKKTHWRQAFLPLNEPVKLHAGEPVRFHLQRPEFGEWTWTMETEHSKQRHSTFLSEPLSISKLRKKSSQYKPVLDNQGKIVLQMLACFDGKTTLDSLATQLLQNCPDKFTGKEQALHFIRRFIEKLDE